MIRVDHLGESSVLNFNISYIEDNACFKFGGVLGGFPFVFKFPSFNYPIFSVYFCCLCVLVTFICFQFLGFFFIFSVL